MQHPTALGGGLAEAAETLSVGQQGRHTAVNSTTWNVVAALVVVCGRDLGHEHAAQREGCGWGMCAHV